MASVPRSGRRGSGTRVPVVVLPAQTVFKRYAFAGEINRMHVQDALSEMHVDVATMDLDRIFKSMGIQDNTTIGFEDFQKVVEFHTGQHKLTRAEVRELLNTFDTDGSGDLDAEEFKKIWRKRMTDSEISETMIMADTNMDGKINLEEFFRMMYPDEDDAPRQKDSDDEVLARAAVTKQTVKGAVEFREHAEEECGREIMRIRRSVDDASAKYAEAVEEQRFTGLQGAAEDVMSLMQWNWRKMGMDLRDGHLTNFARWSDLRQGDLSRVTFRAGWGKATITAAQRLYQFQKLMAEGHNLLPPGLVPFREPRDWVAEDDQLKARLLREEEARSKLRAAYHLGFRGKPASAEDASPAERAANGLGLRRRLNGRTLSEGEEVVLDARVKGQQTAVWAVSQNISYKEHVVDLTPYMQGASLCDMLGMTELQTGAEGESQWLGCCGTLHSAGDKIPGNFEAAQAEAVRRGVGVFVMDDKGKNYAFPKSDIQYASEAAAEIRASDSKGWGRVVFVCQTVPHAHGAVLRASGPEPDGALGDAPRESWESWARGALESIEGVLDGEGLGDWAIGHYIQGSLSEGTLRQALETRDEVVGTARPSPQMVLEMLTEWQHVEAEEVEERRKLAVAKREEEMRLGSLKDEMGRAETLEESNRLEVEGEEEAERQE
eukprot:Hpha_TRINITY_DN14913_c0_g1::TRINITY_DN14913_c0_g1_i1::g.143449::m.143449